MVTIGDELNQICKIESINPNQIRCRTPEKNPYYKAGEAQEVTVQSKLIIGTKCTVGGPCWFTYKADA